MVIYGNSDRPSYRLVFCGGAMRRVATWVDLLIRVDALIGLWLIVDYRISLLTPVAIYFGLLLIVSTLSGLVFLGDCWRTLLAPVVASIDQIVVDV